ncbi:MAG: efflux RND transporter periplasmic adaptor subunit, partial [Alphaproteobacteria bacterium]|nr:efflux RND transporter periplasmic adaptor subunit [Alphaproteobacteria bacterium]
MRKLLLLSVLAAVLAGGYWVFEQAGRPEVRLVAPYRGPAVRAVYATGVVEPEIWAAVAPLEGGRIVSILAFENAEVVAGEPLAELDDQEAEAIIEELEARKSYLEKEVERTRRLLARSIVSEKSHEHALSEHRKILAAIAGAKVRRDHLILRAPISGKLLR